MTVTNPRGPSLPAGSLPPGHCLLRATGKLHRAALAEIIAPSRSDSADLVRGFLEYAGGRGLDVTQAWAVLDESQRVVGSALAVPSPGKVAMVFASQPREGAGVVCVGAAIDALSRDLPGVDLAQAILAPGDRELAKAFEAGGYERLATLSYQELRLPSRPPAPVLEWPEGVEVQCHADLASRVADDLFLPGVGGELHRHARLSAAVWHSPDARCSRGSPSDGRVRSGVVDVAFVSG